MSASTVLAPEPSAGGRADATPPPQSRIRVLPAPDCNPPASKHAAGPWTRWSDEHGWTQETLDLTYTLRSGLTAVPHAPRHLRIVGGSVVDQEGSLEVSGWAARFVQALVEVLTGDRPLSQLMRWTDHRVYDDIRRRIGDLPSRASVPRRGRASVRSLHLCEPREGAAELSAVVRTGQRTRALAVRLDVVEGRWRCTALEIV